MRILAVLACLCMVSSLLPAQTDMIQGILPDIPQIYIDALSYASGESGKSRLDVYMEVPYETLHFLKDGDLFRARFEITIDISDSTDKMLDEKWWRETAETKRYDESTSQWAGKLSQRSFNLIPGVYNLSVMVKDAESGKTSRTQRKVLVRDYETPPFSISDVMLVNYLDTAGGKVTIYPNITGNVGELKKGSYVFFELYNSGSVRYADIQVFIRDIRENVVISDTFQQISNGHKNAVYHALRTSSLPAGEYKLEVRAIPSDVNGTGTSPSPVFAIRPLSVRWRGMPVSIVDLDKAIAEMQYIAPKDKIDEMKDAPPDKKKEMFYNFWKSHDPTPNTDDNELMDEYYSRVNYANQHFSHYLEGWKTDMGMVYIIFGAPNNIERHPFEIDSKPYEIWTYYDQNREFVFVDATGFGDYRLQNPIWDVYRTRPR